MSNFNKLLVITIFFFFSLNKSSYLISAPLLLPRSSSTESSLRQEIKETTDKEFEILYLQSGNIKEHAKEFSIVLETAEKRILIDKFEEKETVDLLWKSFEEKYKNEIHSKNFLYFLKYQNIFSAIFMIFTITLLMVYLNKKIK